ncbi:MAG TPA: TonB-dependent receptor [Steroidobacteraceae bacterium]|nr:TonB-dependent receptor [Steroidobacteraceae bacterium]
MTMQRSAWKSITALLSAAAVAPLAHAAETTRDLQVLQEIIVTATKRSERLQDVPISVSAITGDDITTRGFTNYADFLNSVPGVYFQDLGAGQGTIRIRGISASEGGVPSTTATYFGETVTSVLTNHGGKPNLRLVDIDRVEVLRGPQGTLFGASALAGVVRVIPRAPDLQEFSADVGVRGFTTAHSDDASYHAEAAINLPLVTDKLAVRVVGYKDDIAGFIDNTFAGQPEIDWSAGLGLPDGTLVSPAIAAFRRSDINTQKTWGARGTLTWQASDRLKFELMHTTQDVTVDSEELTDPLGAGEYEQARGLDAFEDGGNGERLDVDSLVISYDWDAVSLLSASSWTEMKRFSDQDIGFLAAASGLPPLPWGLHDRSEGEVFTQEVRLQSRGEQPLQWTLGAYYLDQSAKFSQFVPDYSCPACLGEVLRGQSFELDAPLAKFYENEQKSIFAQVSYQVAEKWTVGIGGRYLEDDITDFDIAADGFLVRGTEPGPTTPEPPQSGHVAEFNPSAYVRFEPSDAATLYAQAAKGFRSGVVNPLIADNCLDQAEALGAKEFTDPDTLWNYELGAKSQLADGRVLLNGAVYRQKWEGVQLGVTLECGFSQILNAGDATSDGAEIELVAQPVDAWRFNLSLAVNNTEFDDVVRESGFVPGERLPDVPKVNGSAGVQYSFELGGSWAGFVRADYVHVGDVRVKFPTPTEDDPFHADVVTQDAFDTANLRLSFQRGVLGLDVFGNNIFDERGVVNTLQPSFGSKQNIIRPRELGVELRYSF